MKTDTQKQIEFVQRRLAIDSPPSIHEVHLAFEEFSARIMDATERMQGFSQLYGESGKTTLQNEFAGYAMSFLQAALFMDKVKIWYAMIHNHNKDNVKDLNEMIMRLERVIAELIDAKKIIKGMEETL